MESHIRMLCCICTIMMLILNQKVQSSADHQTLQAELLSNLRRTLDLSGQQKRQLIPNDDTANRLSVARISSTGLIDDSATVSVFFTGTNDPSVSIAWNIRRPNDVSERLGGGSHVYGSGPYARVSTITLENVGEMYEIEFIMWSEYQAVWFHLKRTAVESGFDFIPPNPITVIEMNKTFTASNSLDLEITAIVKGSPSQYEHILATVDASFVYLDTTVDPPVVETRYKYDDAYDVNLHRLTSETFELAITLKAPYAKFGGILSFTLPSQEYEPLRLGRLYNRYLTEIASYESNEVVAIGNVAIHNFRRQTVLYTPVFGILTNHIRCGAMGNPKPQVSILKLSADNTTEILMGTETSFPGLVASRVTNEQWLYLSFDDPRSAGTYICRATSGAKTVEQVGEVIASTKDIVFDETQTGVMQNTTDKIVISCKASGLPRPTLSLRLNSKYGPDIPLSSQFEVSRTEVDKETEQVTLIISPSNPDIHTVYCEAANDYYCYNTHKRIDVFPENRKDNRTELLMSLLVK